MYRIQKLLNNYGYCSRRKAEALIKEGRVSVNRKCASIGDRASDTDSIYVDGILVKQPQKIYLMFNKPLNCVTALRDKKFKTVKDYIKIKERVFPIGRLDYNTTGLLLFTNDGDFANSVMHPRYGIKKTYLAGLNKPINARQAAIIKKGIRLTDGKIRAQKIKLQSSFIVEITIHEGRKHVVRRIFKELGYNVKSLKRVRIGALTMGNLKPGEYRFLNKKDKADIFVTT